MGTQYAFQCEQIYVVIPLSVNENRKGYFPKFYGKLMVCFEKVELWTFSLISLVMKKVPQTKFSLLTSKVDL